MLSRTLPGRTISSLVLLLGLSLGGCRAQQPWPLWEAYVQHFVDGQGRVIDKSAHDRTTSEGQAYAMFFALVDNDRSRFDSLLHWTQENLAAGDLTVHLPAWDWGRTETGEWKPRDENSASDADLWLAYSLMEAGRLWHEPRYEKLGRIVAAHIAKQDVVRIPGFGATVLPGPHGFHNDPGVWILNPSYLPLPILVYLHQAIPEGPWGDVLTALPKLVDTKIARGYVMDWISVDKDGMHAAAPPAEPSSGSRQHTPAGSFDAIRFYLWLGLADPGTPGLKQLISQITGMPVAMESAATPPLEVDGEGKIVFADAPVGFSAAISPFLSAVGMKSQAKSQDDRLAAMKDSASGLYGHADEYYDQNLVLFSTGFTEQRYRFERDGKLRVKWK